MSEERATSVLAALRIGICDDPCRIKDVRNGCRCAVIADQIGRLRDALYQIRSTGGDKEHMRSIASDALKAAGGGE